MIQTFAIRISGASLTEGDVAALARHPILITRKLHANDLGSPHATWDALRAANPALRLYLYTLCGVCADDQDGTSVEATNTLARWNVDRGHSLGNLNTDNPGLFLVDGGAARINWAGYPNDWVLDPGLSGTVAYAAEAVATDMVGQTWEADGVFCDRADSLPASLSAAPASYANDAAWAAAMNAFVSGLADSLGAEGQGLAANRGSSRTANGRAAWLALDATAHPPAAVLEEGFACVGWGSGSTQFYPAADVKRQIDTLAEVAQSDVLAQGHTDLLPGASGTDNWGNACTYEECLQYALGAFLLGAGPRSYFSFSPVAWHYSATDVWHPAYDNLRLGNPVGAYETVTSGVWRRRYTGGWVLVNGTQTATDPLDLGGPHRLVTVDTVEDARGTLPVASSVAVGANRAVFAYGDGGQEILLHHLAGADGRRA